MSDQDSEQEIEVFSREMRGGLRSLGFPSFIRNRLWNEEDRQSLLSSHPVTPSDDDFSDKGLLSKKTPSTYGSLQTPEEGITLTWRDVSVYVPQKRGWWGSSRKEKPFKRVLNNVSGAVLPGTLVALMGSSGAGKSTLLNALAGKSAKSVMVDGDIFINGFPSNAFVSDISGFVHQDDLFVGSLTVREHLTFMARMKMDSRISAANRNARVNELLKQLGLMKVQDTRIGIRGRVKGISGGERKRLSFASEVLTDPSLLFCDEPTTGLDSFNAKKLVKIMKDMAARRKTIVCTIHQPSSELFSMFDKLLLMAEGRFAFMGNSSEALKFFERLNHKCPPTFNPADFYVHTLAVLPGHEIRSRDRIKRICDNYAVSSNTRDIELIIQHQSNLATSQLDYDVHKKNPFAKEAPKRPSWVIEMLWLFWRSLVDSYRNPLIHGIRIFQKVLIAITIGICFTGVRLSQAGIQNIQGVLFTFVTENTFPALFGVLNVFPAEMPVFLRENKNRVYRCYTYYISKMFALMPGFIVDPFIFCMIAYWMVGLRREVNLFFITVLISVVTSNVSSACGAMFSATFESVSQIMLFLVPFDVILLITGGLFINLKTVPTWLNWIKYLSWFMYSNEALTVTHWEGVTNIPCDRGSTANCITTGAEVIKNYAFSPSHYATDFVAMILMFICFHILGYFGLWYRASRN